MAKATRVSHDWNHGASGSSGTVTVASSYEIPSTLENHALYVAVAWIQNSADITNVCIENAIVTESFDLVEEIITGGDLNVAIYRLKEANFPGANTNYSIKISFDAGYRYVAGVWMVKNVNQTTPDRTPETADSSLASNSVLIPDTSDLDLLIDIIATKGTGSTINNTAGADQTVEFDKTKGTGFVPHLTGSASYQDPEVDDEMSWTFSPNASYAHLALSIIGDGLNIDASTLTLETLVLAHTRQITAAAETLTVETSVLSAQVGTGANVQAGLLSVEATIPTAQPGTGAGVSADTQTVEVSSLASQVGTGINVSTATQALEVSLLASQVSTGVNISAAVQTVEAELLSHQAGVGQDIAAAAQSVEVAVLEATVDIPTGVSANVQTVEVSTLSAQVGTGTNVTPSPAPVQVSVLAAVVTRGALVEPQILKVETKVLEVAVGGSVCVTPNTLRAEVAVGTPAIGLGVLELAGIQTVEVAPIAPSVSQGTNHQAGTAAVELEVLESSRELTASPAAQAVEISTLPAQVSTGTNITPATIAVQILAGTPDILTGTGIIADPLTVQVVVPDHQTGTLVDITPELLRVVETLQPAIVTATPAVSVLARVLSARMRTIQVTVLTGRIYVFQRERVQNAIIERVSAGKFFPVSFGDDGRLHVEGDDLKAVQPVSILADEIESESGKPERNRHDSSRQEKLSWDWRLDFEFDQNVAVEVFERSLLDNPIRLPKDEANGLPQVTVKVRRSSYTHGPHHQESSGTRVVMALEVDEAPI